MARTSRPWTLLASGLTLLVGKHRAPCVADFSSAILLCRYALCVLFGRRIEEVNGVRLNLFTVAL